MENPITKFAPFLVGDYPRNFLKVFNSLTIPDRSNPEEIKKIMWSAYEFGKYHHEGQKRRSGEPYFESHCMAVGKILADWKMDHITVIAGMLHDTIEDTDVKFEDLKQKFGIDVARLVDGVTKLGGIKFTSRKEQQAGNFMKMLLSVAKDLRVIIIKFADRLHNMQTLKYMTLLKQHRIAVETRDVYGPLAHRLGMANVKWELDDLVLKTLHPKVYAEIENKLKSTVKDRELYIKAVNSALASELENNNIKAHIYGRPKSHASIHGKMEKRGKSFDEIYDILAMRIIVEKIEECYLTLGILHQKFKPIQDRFKDFIATPKSNAYQSIHTTVIGPQSKLVEIQIRTEEMEATADIGVAAHWHYKEGKGPREMDKHVTWLRELLDILKSEKNDPKEFMHLLRIDLFDDEIFVFTPRGDLVQLPVKSTPVDFAFQVHSEVGNQCLGAKVNHKIVPLNSVLENGDTIEIITSKKQNPHYGWLSFVITSKARNHINRFLQKAEKEEGIKIGTEILEKTLRRLKLINLLDDVNSSFNKFGYGNQEQLLVAIGSGKLSIRDILTKIAPQANTELLSSETDEKRFSFVRKESKSIRLQGIPNVMTNFGKCCNPIPGDEMLGFITRGRGITVHRSNCPSLPLLKKDSDRLVPVEWETERNEYFNVRLKVVGQDRRGWLKDITETLSSAKVNINSVDVRTIETVATAHFVLQFNNVKQLNRLIKKLSKIPNIDSVERSLR